MLYSCTHMATVGFKGLRLTDHTILWQIKTLRFSAWLSLSEKQLIWAVSGPGNQAPQSYGK